MDSDVVSFVFFLRRLESEWQEIAGRPGVDSKKASALRLAANDLRDVLFEFSCPELCSLCGGDFALMGGSTHCASCMGTVGFISPGGDA